MVQEGQEGVEEDKSKVRKDKKVLFVSNGQMYGSPGVAEGT